jgi:hypothetical protein
MPKDSEKSPPLDAHAAKLASAPEGRHARLRAQLKAVDDQIRITGKPEQMTGLLADRDRIIDQLRELKDDVFLRDYFGKR